MNDEPPASALRSAAPELPPWLSGVVRVALSSFKSASGGNGAEPVPASSGRAAVLQISAICPSSPARTYQRRRSAPFSPCHSNVTATPVSHSCASQTGTSPGPGAERWRTIASAPSTWRRPASLLESRTAASSIRSRSADQSPDSTAARKSSARPAIVTDVSPRSPRPAGRRPPRPSGRRCRSHPGRPGRLRMSGRQTARRGARPIRRDR